MDISANLPQGQALQHSEKHKKTQKTNKQKKKDKIRSDYAMFREITKKKKETEKYIKQNQKNKRYI